VTHQGSPGHGDQCNRGGQSRDAEPTRRCEFPRARAVPQKSVRRSIECAFCGARATRMDLSATVALERMRDSRRSRGSDHDLAWPVEAEGAASVFTPRGGRSARSRASYTSITAPCAACCGKAASRRCASAPEPRSSMLCAVHQQTFERYPKLRASRLYRMVCETWLRRQPASLPPHGGPYATATSGRGVSALCALCGDNRRSIGRTSASLKIGRHGAR